MSVQVLFVYRLSLHSRFLLKKWINKCSISNLPTTFKKRHSYEKSFLDKLLIRDIHPGVINDWRLSRLTWPCSPWYCPSHTHSSLAWFTVGTSYLRDKMFALWQGISSLGQLGMLPIQWILRTIADELSFWQWTRCSFQETLPVNQTGTEWVW